MSATSTSIQVRSIMDMLPGAGLCKIWLIVLLRAFEGPRGEPARIEVVRHLGLDRDVKELTWLMACTHGTPSSVLEDFQPRCRPHSVSSLTTRSNNQFEMLSVITPDRLNPAPYCHPKSPFIFTRSAMQTPPQRCALCSRWGCEGSRCGQ